MNDREIKIVEAAFQVFLRYGVQRTGMNDIAKETGIARQTLYNAFSNKDEVLKATIRLSNERAIARTRTELESASSLPAQLDVIFKYLAVNPYRMLHASPNAEDMIQGMNESSREEIEAGHERFREEIVAILKPYKSHLRKSNIKSENLAELIQRSATAAKKQARDEDHLDELLKTLKATIVCCTS